MKKDSSTRPVRVGLISLGCAKNLVDAEIMLGSLLQAGMEITNDAAQADVVIVNTCSFIDSAQEESVETIIESAEIREAKNRGQGLIVSGCLPQRFRDELPKLLPEVDAFMGIDQVAQVDEIVQRAMQHRAERLEAGAKGEGRRSKMEDRRSEAVDRLAELNGGNDPSAHEDESLRGTGKFGRTRTVLAPKPSALDPRPSTPLVEVDLRPNYIPDFATPRFRLTPRHFAYG